MTDDRMMATILEADGTQGLRFERRLNHPPEKVWRALTESEHLRQWMPCDIVGERRAGAAIELPFWPDILERHWSGDPVLTGQIRVWQPPEVFEWTWETDLLRWELEPVDDGSATLLVFTTWLHSDGPAGTAGTAAGYHVCIEHLVRLLDRGSAPPVADTDLPSETLEKQYSDLLEAP